MKISKAVITAAGPSQRGLALQTLVDRDGQTKTALQIQVEEALSSGVDSVCAVVHPGDANALRSVTSPYASAMHFVEQDAPRGYADAIYRAREFVGDSDFLHLVGDHISVANSESTCAHQLVQVAHAEQCAVSAVQATRESQLPYFGAIGGKRLAGHTGLYEIDAVLEKPTPTEAEQMLLTPGLRAGHYLCFFGMHVLTSSIFAALGELLERNNGPLSLSVALAQATGRERLLALEVGGVRYNIGAKYGLLMAQMALSLRSPDRAAVLAQLVEMLAH
jgi:UTP--glucose-1-phosphate uridylyltransferase